MAAKSALKRTFESGKSFIRTASFPLHIVAFGGCFWERRYGAGLPHQEPTFVDYTKVMNYDKRQVDSQWASIAMTEFVAPSEDNVKVFCTLQTETGDARLLAPSRFWCYCRRHDAPNRPWFSFRMLFGSQKENGALSYNYPLLPPLLPARVGVIPWPLYGHQSKEFASSFKLTGGMQNPEELKEYRDKW